MNAPPMFQRMAAPLFKNISIVKAYIDDIVTGSKSIAKYIGHLPSVCHKIRES